MTVPDNTIVNVLVLPAPFGPGKTKTPDNSKLPTTPPL
jgi:hypothetical protein